MIAATLEQQATEIRALQRTEVAEAIEPFASGQQGSSAMPHKRNPELCERVCGLARLVRGHAVTALENVALWHERDISHSSAERVILPDAFIALDYMLDLSRASGRTWTCTRRRCSATWTHARAGLLGTGAACAGRGGLPRGEAYADRAARRREVWAGDGDLRTSLAAEPQVTQNLSADELDSAVRPELPHAGDRGDVRTAGAVAVSRPRCRSFAAARSARCTTSATGCC